MFFNTALAMNISEQEDDNLLEKQLVVALEILINEKKIIFEIEKYEETMYNYLIGKANYMINYPLGRDLVLTCIAQARTILETKKSTPHIELLKTIFSIDNDIIEKYSDIIKEMERKGVITIKTASDKHISYEEIIEEMIYSGYSIDFNSLGSVSNGTILIESQNYIIYKSIIPNKKPDDYIYNIGPDTLDNLHHIISDYKSGNYILRLIVPDEAFNISITKIQAICKLVWLYSNSPKENNIIDIYFSVINDYFNKFYKLSSDQQFKLNSKDSTSFIREYFKTIEKGFNKNNINMCKKMASAFFTIDIED